MTEIDLIWLGESAPPQWDVGRIHSMRRELNELAVALNAIAQSSDADACLLWNADLGTPDAAQCTSLLGSVADVWHAGLKLGMSDVPAIVDFAAPTWMLHANPPVNIEATSWKLSIDACMVRMEVLRQMGGPDTAFDSLEAATVDMGLRWIKRGVLMRHIPTIVTIQKSEGVTLSTADELYMLRKNFPGWQIHWATFRAAATGFASLKDIISGWQEARRRSQRTYPQSYRRREKQLVSRSVLEACSVTVLIPTVDRYTYLYKLLGMLHEQTIAPLEIIVIDQTDTLTRDTQIAEKYPDLPLHVIYLNEAGQCISRNTGLQASSGDYILFIDDDDEIESDLIERHLKNLLATDVQVSSGVADEVGATLPEDFTYQRASNVFPTNNTMIERDVLYQSGLFDLAYNRGQRADGDLGMRVYLSGAFMLLDPSIRLLHHHAPRGGLRQHKARVITRASSRKSYTQRKIPSATELYLARRYFTPCQQREALWLHVLGTFSIKGNRWQKLLKAIISSLLLPHTLYQTWQRYQQANMMCQTYPQIPSLTKKDQSA